MRQFKKIGYYPCKENKMDILKIKYINPLEREFEQWIISGIENGLMKRINKFSNFTIRNFFSLSFIPYSLFIIFFIVNCHLSINKSFSQTIPEKKPPLTRILFIYDASNSMNATWQSGSRHEIAKRLFMEALDSLQNAENLELALRVYGHQKNYKQGQDCYDTKLEVPFGKNNVPAMKTKIKTIVPKGTTPIALTLEKSGEDFPLCNECRNIIILITDGIEECNGDPCAVSQALQKKGIVLKPFVIGIGLDMEFKKTFECVGNYFDAAKEETFKMVLNIVISQALNTTTAQVNLLDLNSKPTETDVNMTFYDQFSGRIMYNYIHTINHRGNPDTVNIDPISTYKLVVHTLPPVSKDSITLVPGKHNIIALDAPQGYLYLKVGGSTGEYKNLKAIIRKTGEMKTMHVQDFESIIKYIVGDYDLEILSLPRLTIKDVNIRQSHTTTIEIPQPGIASILMNSSGFCSLFIEENNELKWVYNLDENSTKETINLQPGSYRVFYRSKSAKLSAFTIEKTFKITPGSSVAVKMF